MEFADEKTFVPLLRTFVSTVAHVSSTVTCSCVLVVGSSSAVLTPSWLLLACCASVECQCASSDNNRVAQRALQLWKNERFARLSSSEEALAVLMPQLVPALWREKHWWATGCRFRLLRVSLALACSVSETPCCCVQEHDSEHHARCVFSCANGACRA